MPAWWEQLLHVVAGHESRHADLPDLRDLPSRRVFVERTPYIVNDQERQGQADRLYVLRHEPRRAAARAGIAVFAKGRGVGYLSPATSVTLAPLLDAIGGAAVVNGVGAGRGSLRLRVDVPLADAFEAYIREHAATDESDASDALPLAGGDGGA